MLSSVVCLLDLLPSLIWMDTTLSGISLTSLTVVSEAAGAIMSSGVL